MKFVSFIAPLCLIALSANVDATAETDFNGEINITAAVLNGTLALYEPSSIVKFFHSLPHWHRKEDGEIQTVPVSDVKFKAGHDPESGSYFQSLVGFPLLLFSLGVFALLFLCLGILGYMDWAVPKLGPQAIPDPDAGQSEIALWTHKVEMSRKMWVIYFFIALVIGLFGNHIMFYGDDLYHKGYNTVQESLKMMQTNLDSVGFETAGIKAAYVEVEQLAAHSATTCPQMSTPAMQKLIANEYSSLGDIAFNTEVIREAVIRAQADLKGYDNKKSLLLWIFYAVTLGTLLCFVACFFTKQKFFMNISIVVSQIVMIGLLGLCTFELIFMIGAGDFCMDPTSAVVDGLDGQQILQRTAKYYSDCSGDTGNGDNFIHRSLAAAYEKRRELGRALQILYVPSDKLSADIPRIGGPTCNPTEINKNVQNAFYALQALAPNFQIIDRMIECEALHARWVLTFEVGVCSNTLRGVFALWWAQIITTTGLFLTSLTASIMMLYFDDYWNISATMAEKVNAIKAHENDDPYAVESDTTESNPISVGTRSDGYTPVASTSV